jgi:hypothetical protein
MMADKRYNLFMSEEMWDEVQNTARREGLPASEVVRRFVKLGLISTHPDSTLFLHRNGKQSKVRVFPEKHEDEDTLELW